MTTTLSASPSTTIADLTATLVAGFRSATTRSDNTADLRDWFTWTGASGFDGVGCHEKAQGRSKKVAREGLPSPSDY